MWRKTWKFLTLDNLNTQKIELHTSPCWRHSRNHISHLLSKTYKKSHPKTPTLIVLSKFVCYPNNRLVPRESTVVAPISLVIHNILFSFIFYFLLYLFSLPCLSIIQILFRNLLTVSTVKTSNSKQSVEFLYSWAKSHHIFSPLEVIIFKKLQV